MLTTLEEEFAAVSEALGAGSNIPHTPYFCTEVGDCDIILRKSPDRSEVPANSVANQILEDYRPEVLALVGIAGGIADREGVSSGDVVAPNYLHYGEFRKLTSEGDLRRYVPFDQPSVSILETYVHPAKQQAEWHERIAVDPPLPRDPPNVIMGSLVAGEKVYGDPSHYEQRLLVNYYSDAVAVDMESFGVARAVFEARRSVRYNPRLLIVRGVSDVVQALAESSEAPEETQRIEQENDDERRLWKEYAAAVAAAFTADLATRMLTSVDPRADLRGTQSAPSEAKGES